MEKLNPVNAVIFDLDGTLSDCTHRMHYLDNKPKDFDSFYGAMGDDTLVKPVASMLRNLTGVIKIGTYRQTSILQSYNQGMAKQA